MLGSDQKHPLEAQALSSKSICKADWKIISFSSDWCWWRFFHFFSYEVLTITYGEAASLDTCFFFHQLRLSMEHQNRVSINALLLSEVWLGFELGLMRGTPLRNRWNHCDRESDPCSNSSEPSALPLSYPQ